VVKGTAKDRDDEVPLQSVNKSAWEPGQYSPGDHWGTIGCLFRWRWYCSFWRCIQQGKVL